MLNEIHQGDCRDVIRDMENNSIDLVVASPPYNVGVEYGEYEDSIPMEEYRVMIDELFKVLSWKVKDDGRVCVNIALKNNNGIVDIPSIVKEKADVFDWEVRFEIIWNKGNSESSTAWGSWRSPSSPRPIFNHEYILVFDVGESSKDSKKTIEKERFMNLVKSVWNVKPETSSDHPAPFPIEIPKRLIELNSYEEDVVLDPFMGSGTTAIACEKMNREWVGIELNEEYIRRSYERIDNETKWLPDGEGSIFDY